MIKDVNSDVMCFHNAFSAFMSFLVLLTYIPLNIFHLNDNSAYEYLFSALPPC